MHSAQMFTNVVERNELPLYDAGFIFSKKCALYYTMKFFQFRTVNGDVIFGYYMHEGWMTKINWNTVHCWKTH